MSFCDLRVLPVGKFQRDFFVKCISFCANISSGILHRKCANKSHSKRCNFPWADQKVEMQVFLSDCPKGNLSFSQNFDAFEQLVTRQRLLKFDACWLVCQIWLQITSKLVQGDTLHIAQTHIITYDAGAKRVCSSCTSQIFPLVFSIKSKVAEADDIHSN